MLEKSTLEQIETKAPPVTFNTDHYANEHGKAPSANKKGDWSFLPPRHLGKRPLLFPQHTFSDAKRQCLVWIGDRPAYGEFVLIP